MADVTENHITFLETGGVTAKSVLAAEVNFATTALDIVNKEKNLTTCKLTVNHVATPTDEKVPFVDQWWTFTGVDGAKFDGTYKCTAVTVNSSTQTIIHYEHPVSETVGSTVISIAGGAVPLNAFGLLTTNKFGLNNSLTSASDSASNKNQVMISGCRAVYYTNLANANAMFASDTFSSNFALEMTIKNNGGSTVSEGSGFLLRQSAGTNIGDCILVEWLWNTQYSYFLYYYDASAGTITTMVTATHFTGVTAIQALTTKSGVRMECKVSGGKLRELRSVNLANGAEGFNIVLTSGDWQLETPLHIGDYGSRNRLTDTLANKAITDAITVRLT